MILSAGDIVADKYRIERLIGEGGMGTVYAATNQMTGRSVALKWLRANLSTDDTFAQRFLREARVGGRLDHPSIVNVFDVGRHNGAIFLVMELLRGEPFDEWLRRAQPTPAECVGRLMPALRAIAAAHATGVIHRDLKPENIYLCKDPDGTIRQTKVLDFGIAKELGTDDSVKSLTTPGSLVGTIHYMAPEQVRNSRYADARSDVYSIGVILYYALGGGLPYEAESIGELILEIAEGAPEPLDKRNPNLNRKLVEIVMRTMSKDPNARYQTVADLAIALEPFAGGVRFDDLRPESVFSSAQVTTRDVPEVKQTTTMASAVPKQPSVPARRRSLVIVPTLLGLALALLVFTKGSSWLRSKDDPAVSSGGSPAPSAAAETPPGPAEPVQTAEPVAPPVVEPAATPPPSPFVTPPPEPEKPAPAKNDRPKAPARTPAKEPPKAVSSAQPAAPATAPTAAPGHKGSFVYESNPYVHH